MSYPATIIIPLLRQEDAWLEQCVRSAISQTLVSEVLVVTSARTPQSNLDIISSLQRTSPQLMICTQEAGGFPAALNLGIHRASGSRVGFLLSDDWMEPGAVEATIRQGANIVCTGLTTYLADGVTRIGKASGTPSMADFCRLPDLEQ